MNIKNEELKNGYGRRQSYTCEGEGSTTQDVKKDMRGYEYDTNRSDFTVSTVFKASSTAIKVGVK
jgi:hypothetical protein